MTHDPDSQKNESQPCPGELRVEESDMQVRLYTAEDPVLCTACNVRPAWAWSRGLLCPPLQQTLLGTPLPPSLSTRFFQGLHSPT